MSRTSKSKFAHATVVAGTISLLLSSSALAGFHGAGGFRGASFGAVHAPATAIHPSFARSNMLRATNGPAPGRFVGTRAVYRPPFPTNGIAGVASHPQETLPPAISVLKGTPYGMPSGWHGPSVGGNQAPSAGIAAYGVTVATPPAGKTAGQNGAATLGTTQTGGAALSNAQLSALGLLPYNGPGAAAIGSVQLGAATAGNAQIGTRGGLLPYNGSGAAPLGNLQIGATTLRTSPGGQGSNQPGLGTTQAGSGSGTVVTVPAAVLAFAQEEAPIKAAVQLANELAAINSQIQAEVNYVNRNIQWVQTQLQQIMQQLALCPDTGCPADYVQTLEQTEQDLNSEIQALQTCARAMPAQAGNLENSTWFSNRYSYGGRNYGGSTQQKINALESSGLVWPGIYAQPDPLWAIQECGLSGSTP